MATNVLSRPSTTAAQRGRAGSVPVDGGAGEGRGVDSQDRAASPGVSRPRFVLADFVQLTKPGIVVMILITTVASAIIGGGVAAIDWLWLMLGTAAVAGSAGAANQVWECRIDRQMTRTARRPLPDRRMHVAWASAFTAVTGLMGLLVLAVAFGPPPALSAAVTWLVYVLIYTPLKTRSAWNTSVGAVAGGLPMLIGYTAAGGSIFDPTAWLLVGVLVAWQYPHFMAIAWLCREQYARAGFCMTTTIEPTGRSAGRQSIVGAAAVVVFGVALCMIPDGRLAAVVGSILVVVATAPMVLASLRFLAEPTDATSRRLLRSSLVVLPAVLTVVTLRVLW